MSAAINSGNPEIRVENVEEEIVFRFGPVGQEETTFRITIPPHSYPEMLASDNLLEQLESSEEEVPSEIFLSEEEEEESLIPNVFGEEDDEVMEEVPHAIPVEAVQQPKEVPQVNPEKLVEQAKRFGFIHPGYEVQQGGRRTLVFPPTLSDWIKNNEKRLLARTRKTLRKNKAKNAQRYAIAQWRLERLYFLEGHRV